MISSKFSYKKFFITYGIFIGIVAFCILILIYSVFTSKKSWQKNLQVCVEKVLAEKKPELKAEILDFQTIENPFTVNAACYNLKDTETNSLYKAVILRIVTLYGPFPAVYLVDSDNNVEFIGFSSIHGRVAVQLESKKADRRIELWAKRIPDIINLNDESKTTALEEK